jgi:hypothetical protein
MLEPRTAYPDSCSIVVILLFYLQPLGESGLTKDGVRAAFYDDDSPDASKNLVGESGVRLKPRNDRCQALSHETSGAQPVYR